MKKINSILEHHRHWLSQSNGMAVQALEYLDEDLACGTLVGLDNVSDSLRMLAVYHGIQGEVAIYGADASGWEEVSRSIMYRYWGLMLRAKTFSQTSFLQGIKTVPNLTNQLSNAACLLAAFVAADRRDLASSVADVLVGMLTVGGAIDPGYLKERRFEPFMLWIYSVYSGGDASAQIESMNLGVYQKVIDSWADEQSLAGAMEEVCQYHLANTEDKGGDWDPEFKNPPFDLLPLEIGAIYQVRQQIGLTSPVITGPLVSVGTAALENLVFTPDSVAAKVEAAYRNFFSL